MARIVLLIAVVCLMMSAMPNVAAARECGITGFNVECKGNCYTLSWSYVDDCGGATLKIYRQCCPDGEWNFVTVAPAAGTYVDCPAAGCLSDRYNYKLVVNCVNGCDCTGPMCAVQWVCLECD